MAAIATLLMSTLKPGDKVLTHYSLYGGTDDILRTMLPQFGIEAIVADLRHPDGVEDIIKKNKAIKLHFSENLQLEKAPSVTD